MAVLIQGIPQQSWTAIEGTYGEFVAPGSAVPVSYVLTYATLADTGTAQGRLTRDLLPVRELFDVGDLDFSELLQRDLDDHRVATEIIPYLLREGTSARFFPPIMAVVVPAAGKRLDDFYPNVQRTVVPHPGAVNYEQTRDKFGQCIEFERVSTQGEYARTATLRYNPDRSRLVVIDGQHRAMAMLAIRRCKTGDWGDRGRDFKSFYEEFASELNDPVILQKLERIEMPVCICFFPTLTEDSDRSYTTIQACRKLFLDVNKQAKKPTAARTLLLDDLDITSVLTRAVLTRVRNQATGASYGIDLDSFEYDSPRDAPQPTRGLALCTVEMLQDLVYWSAFGDDRYYGNLDQKPPGGRLADPKKERFLREIRANAEIKSSESESWGFANLQTELDVDNVPTVAQNRLSELYMKSWGVHIVRLFSQLHPFKCHIDAVADLRAAHASEHTSHGALAKRALFDGQGIFWTLEHYAIARRRRRAALKGVGVPMLDIEKAYASIVDDWLPKEFMRGRARKFWLLNTKEPTEDQVQSSIRTFKVLRTMAFQTGVLMAFTYLKDKLKIEAPEDMTAAVDSWIEAWNDTYKHDKHLRAFDRGERDAPESDDGAKSKPLPKGKKGAKAGPTAQATPAPKTPEPSFMSSYVGGLKPIDWYWFRYFTFEFLAASKLEFVGKEEALAAAEHGRWLYLGSLEARYRAQMKKTGRSVTKVNDPAADAKRVWMNALKNSVGLTLKNFEAWFDRGRSPLDVVVPVVNTGVEDDGDGGGEDDEDEDLEEEAEGEGDEPEG